MERHSLREDYSKYTTKINVNKI